MNVIAWSENLERARCDELEVICVSRGALFTEADTVSIHLRHSPRSHHLIGTADLQRLGECGYGELSESGISLPCLLACLRQLYRVASEIPSSFDNSVIDLLLGGNIFFNRDRKRVFRHWYRYLSNYQVCSVSQKPSKIRQL